MEIFCHIMVQDFMIFIIMQFIMRTATLNFNKFMR